MAGSKYAYVRNFELPDAVLPGTYIILRIDGHHFHKFSDAHTFAKPNDERALFLMDRAALCIMDEYRDIVLGFGESDEYSFLIHKSSELYSRRSAKIVSTLTSLFTSSYVFHWQAYFPDTPLKYPPSFDGRIVLYPGIREVRDYFAWRQTDTHINNLYNTIFWALIQKAGHTASEAHAALKGTVSAQKQEMLHTNFGINYNDISARFRKGSIIVREPTTTTKTKVAQTQTMVTALPDSTPVNTEDPSTRNPSNSDKPPDHQSKKKKKSKFILVVHHCDIIQDVFWDERPHLLS